MPPERKRMEYILQIFSVFWVSYQSAGKKMQIKFRFKFPGLFFQARPGCGLFCAFLINPIKEGCPPESGIRAFTKTCPVCKI